MLPWGAQAARVGVLLAVWGSLLFGAVPASTQDQDSHLASSPVTRGWKARYVLAVCSDASALGANFSAFEAHLNAVIEADLPGVSIATHFVSSQHAAFWDAVEAGTYDMVLCPSTMLSCLEMSYGSSVIATLHNDFGGEASDGMGAVFLSKAGSAVSSLDDLKGRVIEAEGMQSASFQMARFEARREEVFLLQQTKQVRLTENVDSALIVHHVLSEEVDAGIIRTGVVEKMIKSGQLNWFDIRILNPKNVSWGGQRPTFVTSTNLIPEWGIAIVRPTTMPQALQVRVASALVTIDRTHPAAIQSGYLGWHLPSALTHVVDMQQILNLVVPRPDWFRECRRARDLYSSLTCAAGTFLKPRNEVENACARIGMGCPSISDCLCSPCLFASEVEIRVVRRGGLEIANTHNATVEQCRKMETCARVQQLERITIEVIDHRQRTGVNLTWQMYLDDRAVMESGGLGLMVVDNTYQYTFDTMLEQIGSPWLAVFVDDVPVEQSPIFIRVIPRVCDGAALEANKVGKCTCTTGFYEVDGKCTSVTVTAVSTSMAVLGLTLLLFVLYIRFQMVKRMMEWHIFRHDLVFADPPELLGSGSCAVVYKAEYRGSQVAVKQMMISQSQLVNGRASPSARTLGASVAWKDINKLTHRSTSFNRLQRLLNAKDALSFSSSNNASNASSQKGFKDVRLSPSRRDPHLDRNQPPKQPEGGGFPELSGNGLNGNGQNGQNGNGQNGQNGNGQNGQNGNGQNGNGGADIESASSNEINLEEAVSQHEDRIVDGSATGSQSSDGASASSMVYSRRQLFGEHLCRALGLTCYNSRRRAFEEEMVLLSSIRHKNIVTVIGAVLDQHEPLLIMEWMELGSLHALIHSAIVPIEQEVMGPILLDVVSGLRFLHESTKQIIHGDIKSRNILVDGNYRAKVSDLGVSSKRMAQTVGTLAFLAPELLSRSAMDISVETDVYAFGIMLWEVLAKKEPFEGVAPIRIMQDVVKGGRPEVPEGLNDKMMRLMTACWAQDPTQRPTLKEVEQELRSLTSGGLNTYIASLNKDRAHQKQHTSLLSDVFPPHIIEQLISGQKVKPEHKDSVTIFFSDIVGFTNISGTMPPAKVADMLDRLYTRFDTLATEREVFKVETIGDAWMGVTNLAKSQSDHAVRIALFALDAVEAASHIVIDEEDESKGTVQIRVGFHSGPVVANIVGKRNPRYCLFGDTVNTASRMESNSEALKIHCSREAAVLLKNQSAAKHGRPNIRVESRGQMEIKGKGLLETFFVYRADDCVRDLSHSFPASLDDKDHKTDRLLKPCTVKKMTPSNSIRRDHNSIDRRRSQACDEKV